MKKWVIVLLLFLALVASLVIPLLLRMHQGNGVMYGSDSVYTQRMIVNYKEYDTLQQRAVPFNFFFYVLSIASFKQNILIVLPLILGAITFVFFYLLVRKQNFGYIMLLLLLASPVFNFMFTSLQPYTFALTLTVIGLYIFIEHKSWISVFFFGLVPLIDVFFGFSVILMLVFYCLFKKEYTKTLFIVLIAMLVPSVYMVATNTITAQGYFALPDANNFFVELGAFPGISITLLLLSLLGISSVWKLPKDRFLAYLIFIGTFLLALTSSIFFILFSCALPFFGAYTIRYFWDRKWTFSVLKNITYILILCSLLFPTIIAYNNIASQPPSKNMISALYALHDKYEGNGKVFSNPENGFLIQYYAKCPTFVDRLTDQYPYADQNQANFAYLLQNRNLLNTTTILDQNNITYIYVDAKMKESYWNNQEEGILFLMKYNKEFSKIYSKDGIDIYKYSPVGT